MKDKEVLELLKVRYKVIDDVKSGIYSISDHGFVINNKTGRRLKTYLNKKERGYVYVKLQDGRKSRSFHVGNLVGKAFVDNPENKKTVNHDDGNKLNNHFSNLTWNTHKENSQHAFQTGLGKSGFDHYRSRFSHEDFWEIKYLKEKGLKNFEIARLYNVSETAVRNLCLGNSYKHVQVPKFNLLAPRFKLKIPYPFSCFKVGEIITTGNNSFLFRTLTQFPEVFISMQWWEDRAEDEMPKYVKLNDKVYEAKSYSNYMGGTFYVRRYNDWMPMSSYPLKDALPATEEEYNQYTKQF